MSFQTYSRRSDFADVEMDNGNKKDVIFNLMTVLKNRMILFYRTGSVNKNNSCYQVDL